MAGPFTRRRLINDIATLENSLAGVVPFGAGARVFVHGLTGVDAAAYGDAVATPYDTLAYAIGVLAARAGTIGIPQKDDLCVMMAEHTEAIVGAAGLTFNVNGVRYIGLGHGRARPKFTWGTSTAAQVLITGGNTLFKNLVFDFTGIDAIVAAMLISAADVTFEDCEFITNSATAGCVLGVLTAATADRLTFRRCNFIGAQTNSGTTTTAQIKHEVGADLRIEDCLFTGKMTQAILNATTVLRARISRNYIHTYTGTLGFSFETSSTGLAADNRICVASGTTPVAGAALSYSGNRYTTEANGPTGGTADAF